MSTLGPALRGYEGLHVLLTRVGRDPSWSLGDEASLQSAKVLLDGKTIGTAPPSASGAARLTGHGFSSAGKGPTGGDFWIDDVRFVDE